MAGWPTPGGLSRDAQGERACRRDRSGFPWRTSFSNGLPTFPPPDHRCLRQQQAPRHPRDFTRPEPAPVDTTPREPSFADKLITFAQPILEQAGGNHTAAKGAMNVAILIWNAAIEGGPKIQDAKATLAKLPGASAEQVEELVTTMVARKTEQYPEEKMIVTNFILKFSHKRGAQFRVSAVNINPEGVKKADLSDMVKVTA